METRPPPQGSGGPRRGRRPPLDPALGPLGHPPGRFEFPTANRVSSPGTLGLRPHRSLGTRQVFGDTGIRTLTLPSPWPPGRCPQPISTHTTRRGEGLPLPLPGGLAQKCPRHTSPRWLLGGQQGTLPAGGRGPGSAWRGRLLTSPALPRQLPTARARARQALLRRHGALSTCLKRSRDPTAADAVGAQSGCRDPLGQLPAPKAWARGPAPKAWPVQGMNGTQASRPARDRPVRHSDPPPTANDRKCWAE